MEKVGCLNFCELLSYFVNEETSREAIRDIIAETLPGEQCKRVYFGSNFCSQYFLQLETGEVKRLIETCRELHIKITMVVPVFSEKDLQAGKRKIILFQPYFGDCIDEITVNDYGMLVYISSTYKIKINLGRLFMKDYRDPRYEEYRKQTLLPSIFQPWMERLLNAYPIHGMEFDGTHKVIDFSEAFPNLVLGLHSPFCYLTKGHICGYASILKERVHKFRPNIGCNKECQQYLVNYEVGGDTWTRFGRTIYYPSDTQVILGCGRLRTIYFPLEKVVHQ